VLGRVEVANKMVTVVGRIGRDVISGFWLGDPVIGYRSTDE
jgi:hypothetical protein